MKNILFLTLCMFSLPIHAYEKDNLIYEIISEDEATVSVRANEEGYKATSLVIPETVDIDGKTYTVTEVECFGFSDSESLVDVKLPSTLKLLGQQCFDECYNLKSVDIPNGCKLESYIFYGCLKLERVHLPEDLTFLDEGTFAYCRCLTDINIPSTLEEISWYAFSGCWKLNGIQLPPTLTSIGKGAFKYCLSLGEISIPETVTTLMAEAFAGCISLEKANIPRNLTKINEALFDSCLVLQDIVIPENVKVIRTAAFRDCKSLRTITIPQQTGIIYQEAFAGCDALQEIICLPTVPPTICERTFLDYTVPLTVAEGTEEKYSIAPNWSRFMEAPLLLTIHDAVSNDAVSMKVEKGQSIQLAIRPSDNWQVHSATYNGEDITQQLSSLTSASIFQTPAINSNAILSITYEQRPNGIGQTEYGQQTRINVSGNTVSVTDGPDMIEVFTLQGHHVVSQPTSGGKAQFALPAGQCYLIKAGKKTIKVLL